MAARAEIAMVIKARNEATRVLRGIEKDLANFARSAESMASGLNSVGNQMSIVSGLAVGAFAAIGGAAVKMAMNAVESENLFKVSMGDMEGAARQFSERLRTDLGLNATEIRKQVGTFNVMFTSMGVGTDASFEMAKGLTQLTQDMASFFNLAPAEAFQKLQAGITGETEPLKRLGIVVNETSVQQYALTQGLIKQGEEMSEAQKVVARYGLILERTSAAQGDLARTIDSPTNQLRIMQAQFAEVRKEVGDAFLPVVATALTWINDEGLPRVRQAVRYFSDAWVEMGDEGRARLIGIGLLLLAAGPIAKGVAFTIKVVGMLAKAFLALKIVSVGALGKIGVAVAAATVIAYLFVAGLGAKLVEFGKSIWRMAGTVEQVALFIPQLKGASEWLGRLGDSAISTGVALKQPLLGAVGAVRAGLDEVGEVIAEGALPQFAKLTDELARLGAEALKSFDAVVGFEKVGRQHGPAIPMAKPDIGELFRQAGKGLPDIGAKAKAAGISVGDLVKAMITLSPASQAAAAAVAAVQLQLTGLESAQQANTEATRVAQEQLRGMQETVSRLGTALSDAKSNLDKLSQPKLTGMGELDENVFQAEQQIKRLQLAEKGIQPTAFGPMSDAARAFVATLPDSVEGIQELIEVMRLQGSLNYDEKLREIGKAAKGVEAEMSFEDAIAAIAATHLEIGNLGEQLTTAEQAVVNQEAAIRSLEEAGRALTRQIQDVREQLRLQEERQKAVNEALEIAYRWFIEDREKLMEMGGEAVTQAGIIDEQTRALLSTINEWATNEAALAIAKINAVVDAWKAAKAEIDAIAAGITPPGGTPPSGKKNSIEAQSAGGGAWIGASSGSINEQRLADLIVAAFRRVPLVVYLDGQQLSTRAYGLAHSGGGMVR